jgi:hypothetical protein
MTALCFGGGASDGQPEACAGCCIVQPLELAEDSVAIDRCNPWPRIRYLESELTGVIDPAGDGHL